MENPFVWNSAAEAVNGDESSAIAVGNGIDSSAHQPLVKHSGHSNGHYLGPPEFNLYLFTYQRWWKLVAVAVLTITIATGLYTYFWMGKVYRATATLKPTPSSKEEVVGAMIGRGVDLNWLSGQPGREESVAQEFITIFQSRSFNYALATRHRITLHILRPSAPGSRVGTKDDGWSVYRALQSGFKAEFSFRTGNITLFFIDSDPIRAARILGYYIDDLRDKLRREEIEHRRMAVASLTTEINQISDPLLRESLYGLLAKEVEREKVAEIEADFAFKVMDPPYPPDRTFAPIVRSNCLIAAVLSVTILGGAALLYEFLALLRIRESAWESQHSTMDFPGNEIHLG